MKRRLLRNQTSINDRLSPSIESLDSGFGSGPSSPDSVNSSINPSINLSIDPLIVKSESGEPQKKVIKIESRAESTRPQPSTSSCSHSCTSEADSSSILTTSGKSVKRSKYACYWKDCEVDCSSPNGLYDHAVEKHIIFTEIQTKKDSGRNGRRKSMDSDERFTCHWKECGKWMKRGTDQKKFEWLQSHFLAHHAPKAVPFPCLITDCNHRFHNQKALRSHLNNSHDDRKKVKKVSQTEENSESWFRVDFLPRNYTRLQFMDQRTYNWIDKRLKELHEEVEEEEEEESHHYQPSSGQINTIKDLIGKAKALRVTVRA